jgi:hypothetical protein
MCNYISSSSHLCSCGLKILVPYVVLHLDLSVAVDPQESRRASCIQQVVTCCMLLPHSNTYSTIGLEMYIGALLILGGSLVTHMLCTVP